MYKDYTPIFVNLLAKLAMIARKQNWRVSQDYDAYAIPWRHKLWPRYLKLI